MLCCVWFDVVFGMGGYIMFLVGVMIVLLGCLFVLYE